MIDILLKYILWYDFLNDLDTQSSFVTKKPVKYNHSYLKNALINQSNFLKGWKLDKEPIVEYDFIWLYISSK